MHEIFKYMMYAHMLKISRWVQSLQNYYSNKFKIN